jgi:signal transduction histidine kinase
MKIGTRVTLLTVLLVVLTLGIYGLFSVRTREAELREDLERQTQLFGSSLTVALEAALQEGLFEDVRHLIARMQKTEQPIQVVFLDLLHPKDSASFGQRPAAANPSAPAPTSNNGDEPSYAPPPPDPTREGRLRRLEIADAPYGEHVTIAGRPVYAYMVPLHGSGRRLVAVIDLISDERPAQKARADAQRDVALTITLLCLALALLVGLTVQRAFSAPLSRLVGGIDEVTSGDYTGVILRERDDEVGILADRFNEMTRSLRLARQELLASVDAKLQLEMRLRQADKLATIGQLAAGIAHEVGTPLNVIGGRARAMARRPGDPAVVEKNAAIIADQAERITKIIQQLLDYARSKAPARAPVNLERVAAVTLDFLEHQFHTAGVDAQLQHFQVAPPGPGMNLSPGARPGPDGTFEFSGEIPLPPPATPVVVGDADQLQQVCLNLCLNAIQAMPEGGSLTLSLLGLVRRRPGLDRTPPGPYVMLAVTDSGVGIPEEDLPRIFEPFYSGRRGAASGRPGGTGLGLSVSAGIVKDHDGWIEVERRPEGGTTFRLYLPAPDPFDEEQEQQTQ